MKEYVVQPIYIQDRTANYEKSIKILSKWENISEKEYYELDTHGLNGNICSYIEYDTDKKNLY